MPGVQAFLIPTKGVATTTVLPSGGNVSSWRRGEPAPALRGGFARGLLYWKMSEPIKGVQ